MEKTARFLHMFSSAKAAGLGVFGYDSITVSYAAWELISVSMCYSQGDRFNTSLSNRLCTVPLSYFPALLTYRLACSVYGVSWSVYWGEKLPVAWSCATRDDANKDNMFTPTISSGINCQPPSRPSRTYPECRAYETRWL